MKRKVLIIIILIFSGAFTLSATPTPTRQRTPTPTLNPTPTSAYPTGTPDWGPPPNPPADDDPGDNTPPEEEMAIPETIIYDDTDSTGRIVCTEIDPETSEPIDVTYASDQMVIRFIPGISIPVIDSILASVGAWKKINIQALNVWSAGMLPATSCEELQDKIDQLKLSAHVIFANKSGVASWLTTIPDDTLFNDQWSLQTDRINMPTAWDIQQGKGNYATISAVDTGVSINHPDLAANLIESMEDKPPYHGTKVAGIMAAVTNNNLMIAGTGWNVRAMVKSSNNDDIALANQILNILASNYRIPGGIVALNMSWGFRTGMPCVEYAINLAFNAGILPVAASGDNYYSKKVYPAVYPRAMAIGATQQNKVNNQETRADLSSYGPHISVVAPGENILTTIYEGNSTGRDTGTSFAAPHVTGLAGLVRSEFQSMRQLDVRYRIEDTASDNVRPNAVTNPLPGCDSYTGWGFIQADDAIANSVMACHITAGKWYLMVLPVWPKKKTNGETWQMSAWPQNVLPPLLTGRGKWLISRLNPYRNSYINQDNYFNGKPLLDPVTPYRAYWIKLSGLSGQVYIPLRGAGAGIKAGHALEFPLYRNSPNMVGNPFLSDIKYTNDYISFRSGNSGETKKLSEAIAAQWICGNIYYWDPETASYITVAANMDQIIPKFQGFFINVKNQPEGETSPSTLYMLMKHL